MHIYQLLILMLSMLLFSCRVDKKEAGEKKVFNYNQPSGIGSLDPAFASNQANIWACNQLFNGLVELDDNMKVIPCLAKSWEVSEDQKKYSFTLNKEVYFHSNKVFKSISQRKLTAYDVEYSLRRIIDSTGLFNKGMWIFKDKVLKKSNGTLSDTCFKAQNDSVFTVYLEDAYPYFLEILAMPYCFVVSEKAAEHYGLEFRSHPIGTGPFQFHLWEESNALILHKNQNYWRFDHEGNQLPYLDAIKIGFIADLGQAFRNFLLGNLDFVSGIDESMVDEVLNMDGTIRKDFNEKYTVEKGDYLNTEYLCFQLDSNATCYSGFKDHPFWNVDFRKALSFSIDKNALVLLLKNDLGEPGLHGIVPPAVPYFNQKVVKGNNYNPDSALYYFNKSGWKNKQLPKIVLTVGKEHKSLSEILMKQWKEVLGIEITIDLADYKVYRSASVSGQIPFFRASWLGDYPDAESYLSLFNSGNQSPNGPNKSRYSNSIYDSLYNETKYVFDPIQRAELYEQMDQIMINEAPVIPLYYDEVLRLTQKNVSGLSVNAMNVLKLEKVDK